MDSNRDIEEATKGINEYYVSAKDSLLQSVLDKMDPGNGAAIYSLENLKGTKLEVKKSWFESSWKEFGSSVTELKDFKDSADLIDVVLVKTDLGIQTVLYAYPTAGKREEHADEGYKVIYEKELYELPLLERCARSGYIMTKEEEKQVEKEVKAYFSIKENKFARDIALNLGPDMVSQSTKLDFTLEEHEKFQQMYLLYRKTNDMDAFSYGFYSNFLLTKAGEKLSKVPIIGKFGAESLTNILADTTLDTAIDTIPSMVEIAMDGGSAGDVALEGLKRTGINLGANGAFEAVFKVGKGVLGGSGKGGLKVGMNFDEVSGYLKGLDFQNMNVADLNWYLNNVEKIDLGNMDVAKLQTQILQDAGFTNFDIKGNLADISAFKSGTIRVEEIDAGLVLYRRGYPTEGTGGYGYGQWWSDSRLSIEDAREQLAILENWGNPLTGEYEMTVPQGTKAITGIAEEQYFYDDITGELLEHRGGGAKQYWFNSINESWIK